MFDFDQLSTALLVAAFRGGPFVVALLLAILVPVLLLGAGNVTRRWSPSLRLSMLYVLMIFGTVLSVALSGRVLHSSAELAANPMLGLADEELSGLGRLASQAFTAAVLLVAGAEWANWITRGTRMPGRAAVVWRAMLFYFLCSIVVSGIAGEFRNPRLNDLYVPFMLTAVALLAQGADADMWRRVRWALLLPSLGSLLTIPIKPDLVLLPGYGQAIIPGLDKRLYGLTDHANTLGVFAAVGLVLELAPFVRARPNLIMLLVHACTLLLTQSKTAWIGAVIGALLIRWLWLRETLFKGDRRNMAMFTVVAVCCGLALLAAGLAVASGSPRVARLLDRIGAFSFTGRTVIWEVTLDEFSKNPITGYGPSLWDLQFRYAHGLMAAGQAHNQFMQILGQAGLLGLAAMVYYLGTLARFAARTAGDGGWALVLVLFLLTRCLAESPLRMSTVLGSDWIHFAAFAAVVQLAAQAQRADARGATRVTATAPTGAA